MNRLGLLQPSELTPTQRENYDIMHKYTTSNYSNKFIYLDAESRLVGPFGIQLHHATLGNAFIEFAKALRSIPDFEPEVRECAILGVGYRMQAAYEEYAHAALSGFSKQEQDMLHHGQCPEHFSAAQKIAYKVAVELGKPGAMSSELWDQAMNIFGRNGTTALIHYVGFYSYVSTILNGFDAQVPK